MHSRPRTRRRLFASVVARGTSVVLLVLLVSLVWVGIVGAQDRGAVVHGASKVFVRRGPGMSFPPFARLSEGTVVQVKGQQGQWVRIKTTGGQMGFVSAKYLMMLDRDAGGITPPEETPTATKAKQTRAPRTVAATHSRAPAPTAAAPAPTAPVDEGVEAAPDDTASAEAEFPDTPISSRLAADPSRPTMAEERAAIADEVRRLTNAVSTLQQRIEENEPIDSGFGDDAGDEAGAVSGGAVLLGLLGVVVGWFLGSRYGRAQERGRRSRIRF